VVQIDSDLFIDRIRDFYNSIKSVIINIRAFISNTTMFTGSINSCQIQIFHILSGLPPVIQIFHQ